MLCDDCSRFGVAVKQTTAKRMVRPAARSQRPVRDSPVRVEYDLATDFPDRIRRGREAVGWKREDLARRINEKHSIIEKLEKGNIRPDDQLISKLERALGIRLRERIEEVQPAKREKSRPLTLGDLIKRQS